MEKVNKKIMIAEDDEGILGVIKTLLEMNGYEVLTTSDDQTMQKVKEHLPDLLLLDIWMGKLDGREVCKYLKNQKQTRHIPIIMFSATRDLEKSTKEAGADDFIEKPFEIDDLLNKVKKHLA